MMRKINLYGWKPKVKQLNNIRRKNHPVKVCFKL